MADPGRGTLTGNRGILHDDQRRLVRGHASVAWITCVLSWRGRRRPVMTGRTWTELFFLDEASALAAGHRPCAYCRRGDYNRFVTSWSEGNPDLAPTSGRRAPVIDRALHQERRTADGRKRTWIGSATELPEGAMVVVDSVPALVAGDRLVPWSFGGYRPSFPVPSIDVEVLTPPSTVEALRRGYRPAFHPSLAPTRDPGQRSR